MVGGGAAGLSAALVLGRARLRTLVVDAGRPSNLAAQAMGGVLGHDGKAPADLYAAGRREVTGYGVEIVEGEAVAATRDGAGFEVTLDGGERVRAAQVLLAPGMDYRYPDLPGAAERWGGSVFHCPFCHGWEVRERPLAVYDPSPAGARRALLLRRWSDDVTLLGGGEVAPEDEQRLRAAGVRVDPRAVAGLRGDLEAVEFSDGGELACGGLLIGITMHQRSGLAEQLGAALDHEHPLAPGAVVVDALFATSVPGLFAAGDVTGRTPSVASAIGGGAAAAQAMVQARL